MLHFELLADRIDAIGTVAQWYFDQWGQETAGETPERIEVKLQKFLNRDCVPLMILAVDGSEVIGCAELKFREMDIYPEREHWLGGVYVMPERRGAGVGSSLADKVAEVARSLEVEKLSLQTEQHDGGIYARLGWKPVERVHHHGRDVVVMERELRS